MENQMKLSKKQIRKLELLREQYDKAPTILGLFSSNLYRYLALMALCFLTIFYYQWVDLKIGYVFFSGIYFAIFMREFQLLRRYVIDWPLTKATTNWAHVNELLSINYPRAL